jgi:hypothetical protein
MNTMAVAAAAAMDAHYTVLGGLIIYRTPIDCPGTVPSLSTQKKHIAILGILFNLSAADYA